MNPSIRQEQRELRERREIRIKARRAFNFERDTAHNPFPRNTLNYRIWEEGWNEAEQAFQENLVAEKEEKEERYKEFKEFCHRHKSEILGR